MKKGVYDQFTHNVSIVLVFVDHFLWFNYFTKHYRPFMDIASFFGLCVWLVPFAYFISLSANDNALPTNSGKLHRISWIDLYWFLLFCRSFFCWRHSTSTKARLIKDIIKYSRYQDTRQHYANLNTHILYSHTHSSSSFQLWNDFWYALFTQ